MRTLVYVADAYPALSQTFTLREVRALKASGLPTQVVALHPSPAVAPAWDAARDPEVVTLPSPFSAEVAGAVLGCLARRPARLLPLAAWCLRRQARPIRWGFQWRAPVHLAWACWLAGRIPSDAHLHAQFAGSASTVAWMASRLLGTTFSFRAHSEWSFALGAPKLRDAVVALTISDHERSRLVACCAEGDPALAAKVRVDRLGIELDEWAPAPPPAAEGPLRIAAVGMLGATKGHDVLLEALALMRDRGIPAEVDVAGEGPERGRLEAIIARRSLRGIARLRGAMPNAEIRSLLRAAHVSVLACRVTPDGDFDGIPVALMEAMATARPVVTCAVSALPELVEDGISGIVVAPERPDLLADALARLASDPELRSRLGQGARRRVEERHDAREAASRLGARFHEILRAPR